MHPQRRRAQRFLSFSRCHSYSLEPSAGRRWPAFIDDRWAAWCVAALPSRATLASAPAAVAVRGGSWRGAAVLPVGPFLHAP